MDRVPPVRIPAAARSTLVGDGALLQFYGEVARQRTLTLESVAASSTPTDTVVLTVEPTDNTGAGQSATQVLDSLEVKGRTPASATAGRLLPELHCGTSRWRRAYLPGSAGLPFATGPRP